MYSLKHKLYISQRTENQWDAGLNVGFVYSLYSFLFPLLFTYIDRGVFYKLGDKERSKESAYVLVGFLARPFVSFVSHIARYAPSSTDKNLSLRNQKSTQPNF